MSIKYNNTYVKQLLDDQNCDMLSDYVNNQTSIKFKCRVCGKINSSRINSLLTYQKNNQLFCRYCKQYNRSICRIEQHIKERLHEEKQIVKLTDHNIWLMCDHCHQVKPVNRKFFLTKDYLSRYDDVCCTDCGQTRRLKKQSKAIKNYRQAFEQADVNHEYELLTDYVDTSTKVSVKHNVCGHTYMVAPREFVNHGRRCPYCAGHIFTKDELKARQKEWEHNSEIMTVSDYDLQPIVFNPKPPVELWKRINSCLHCDGYEVSNWGRVRRIGTHQLISARLNRQTKYQIVSLITQDHHPKTISVHRLVALTWVPGNENNDPHIYANHINEDRNDNWSTNLEWCDDKYNSNYGSAHQRQVMSIRKHVFTKVEQWNAEHTKLLKTYNSIRQASIGSGIGRAVIKRIAQTHELKGWPYDFEIIGKKEK